jgi:hypothetical protein
MYKEHAVHTIAGTFILVSLLLSQLHSVYWLLFTGFVGLNLFQHGFSRWCLMEKILHKAGFKSYSEPN